MGDVLVYHNTGMITDSKGKVVVKDPTAGEMLMKTIGFTPKRVTDQYDVVRTARRETTYARAIRKNYADAYLKAYLKGDRREMREVMMMVREWNRANRKSSLYIANFGQTVKQVIKANKMTASERFKRTAPRAARSGIKELQKAYDALP